MKAISNMHQPVIQHPIFESIEQRIDKDDYQLSYNGDSWSQEISIHFNTGWRKWLVAEIDFASWFLDEGDGIRNVRFYAKPGFLQPRQFIDTCFVPPIIVQKIRAIASEWIMSDKVKNRIAHNNRIAATLDNL